jgi:hypothetical protein
MIDYDKLEELNFKKLLDYEVAKRDASQGNSIKCNGFCTSCDEQGLLQIEGEQLDKMSHGASTQDFQTVIEEPLIGKISAPIVFLFESPGGDYKNGDPTNHNGFEKEPPTNHFYWVPQPHEKWNREPSKSYGPYLENLIFRYGFENAYFTNVVKCSRKSNEKVFIPWKYNNLTQGVINNCSKNFLSEELDLINPAVIFFFGGETHTLYKKLKLSVKSKPYLKILYHPAAIISQQKFIEENDLRIKRALGDMKLIS